jgi:hypothetical protein
MSIATRVVCRSLVTTVKAYVEMTAEQGGATTLDSIEHPQLLAAQNMALPKRLAILTDYVRKLKGGARRCSR